MIDIGQGSMAMVTSSDIPVSTVLSMRFALVNVDKEAVKFSGPLEVTGEVRSNAPLEKNEHRLGIYFTKMKSVEYKNKNLTSQLKSCILIIERNSWENTPVFFTKL